MTSKYHQRADKGGSYTFQSRPRPLDRHARCFYDDLDSLPSYGNIMYDRRVIRGNTYALNVYPATMQPDPIEIQKRQEIRRRALAKKRAQELNRDFSPEAVFGREHAQVQTGLYLEELSDRIEEADVNTQTDAFLDRPPTPLFIPAKTGQDISTQILEGELFDFDIEVKPILEVLVGKTTEQALIEVLEEEELANLRQQQREFEELRNAELAEMQRLEEQERRRREEKERRMQQQREVLKKEKETANKLAARAFAISYMSDLVPTVFDTLRNHGYFYDPVSREMEQKLMPFLKEEVVQKVDNIVLGRNVLDQMISEVVTAHLNAYEKIYNASEKLSEESTKLIDATSKTGTDQPASQSYEKNGSLSLENPNSESISAEKQVSGTEKQSSRSNLGQTENEERRDSDEFD